MGAAALLAEGSGGHDDSRAVQPSQQVQDASCLSSPRRSQGPRFLAERFEGRSDSLLLNPAAIRQYSMAVAPDSSRKNFESNFRIFEKLLSRQRDSSHAILPAKSRFQWLPAR